MSTPNAYDVTVIVPAYNEAQRITPTLDAVLAYLQRQAYRWELLVVDDGSRDQTAAIVTQRLADDHPHARLISYQPNQGKGYAVRTGVLAATGHYIVFLDADLSTPIEEMEAALAYLQQGYDMVVGSRRHPQSQIERQPPLFRRFATFVFDVIKHLIVGLWQYSDTQCGFKAYRRQTVTPLYQRSVVNRFMFDVELLFLAERSGLRTIEMPVRWADAAGSKVRFFEGVYNMVRDLIRIRRVHHGFRGPLRPTAEATPDS